MSERLERALCRFEKTYFDLGGFRCEHTVGVVKWGMVKLHVTDVHHCSYLKTLVLDFVLAT